MKMAKNMICWSANLRTINIRLVLTNSKLLSTVTEMIIDQNKQYDAFKLDNAILLKLKLITVVEKQKKDSLIIKYRYKNIGTN